VKKFFPQRGQFEWQADVINTMIAMIDDIPRKIESWLDPVKV
jgi:hypothetical protein